METRGIKIDISAIVSSPRPRRWLQTTKLRNVTGEPRVLAVYRSNSRMPRKCKARIAQEIVPPAEPADRPSKNQVPWMEDCGQLRQVTPPSAKWVCRSDLRVGRSLIRCAGRGLYCLSETRVEPGEKLLPYWRPNRSLRRKGFDAGTEKYWYGDDVHGYLNLEGAEHEGYLAGMINDNGTFDHSTCNCYIEWDEDTEMFWVYANEGWEQGTVCELYIFYGVQYWFYHSDMLTHEKRKLFHSRHLRDIQKLIDSQDRLVYIDPFTRQPALQTEALPTAETATPRARSAGPGRPRKSVCDRSRSRGRFA